MASLTPDIAIPLASLVVIEGAKLALAQVSTVGEISASAPGAHRPSVWKASGLAGGVVLIASLAIAWLSGEWRTFYVGTAAIAFVTLYLLWMDSHHGC